MSQAPVVTLTAAAADAARRHLDSAAQGGCLRLGARSGGCTGYQYQLAMDHRRDGDLEWEQDGVTVVMDPSVAPLLAGSTLDYKSGLQESGFVFDNPNAVTACGCGSSFRVTDDEGCGPAAVDGVYGAEESAL